MPTQDEVGHAPLRHVGDGFIVCEDEQGSRIGEAHLDCGYDADARDALAERIIRACNCHDELLAALEKCRRKHNECEDSFYSCPASGDGRRLWPEHGAECDCGADEFNAIIDAAIAKARKGPA